MTDQATSLRDLMVHRLPSTTEETSGPHASAAHTITLLSGKGGVGKSNIALNLSIAMSRMDLSVCLFDANFGLGNIELLCGLNGYWNLSHVVTGARTLQDIILEGPEGLSVVPGASGLNDVADCPSSARNEILNQLQELEQSFDVLIIDTGTGIHNMVRRCVATSDVALIVTTPEPTSIADAYATIKSLSRNKESHLQVLVNQAGSNQQARAIIERLQQTARLFVRTEVESAGFIPRDDHVPLAVASRSPFIITNPLCPASQAIQQLARRIKNRISVRPARGAFFQTLLEPSRKKSA